MSQERLSEQGKPESGPTDSDRIGAAVGHAARPPHPVPGVAAGRPRRALAQLVKTLFGVLVLVFGVIFVARRWNDLTAALAEAKPVWIVVALALAAAGQWAAAFGFGSVLTAVSDRLPSVASARIYFVSQLGKYIPGSVWPIVAVAEMCRRHRIGRLAAATSGALAMLFSLITAGLVGIVLVLVGSVGGGTDLWWLLLLIPLAVLIAQPRVIKAIVNLVMRLARRPHIELDLTWRVLRGSLGWPMVSWLLLGGQCWALVVALGGDALSSLAPAIGGFALAYAAGTLFIPAPAGAGVREAVLAVALAGVIDDNSTFTHDSVIVVVLLSRVLLAVLDFAQAGVAVLVARRSAAGRPN